MANKVKISRLPFKNCIIKAKFPKGIYSQEKIETEVNKLTQRYPDKEFQVFRRAGLGWKLSAGCWSRKDSGWSRPSNQLHSPKRLH